MADLSLPISCAELLPHRDSMLLLDRLVEYQPGQARVAARAEAGGLFVDARGRLDPAAVVELAAQGAAALKGYEARLKGEPVKIGYLVGIRDFEIGGAAEAGEELEIAMRLEFAMEQAALMHGEVRAAGRLIGAGTIKIWEEKEWPRRPTPPEAAPARAMSLNGQDLKEKLINDASSDPIGRALAAALAGLEPGARENQVVGWFCFGEDFAGFRGHFPGFPILPAVLMPRLALLLAGARPGGGATLKKIATAKISQGIFPGQPIRVEVTLDETAGAERSIKAKLTGPGGAVASFSLAAASCECVTRYAE